MRKMRAERKKIQSRKNKKQVYGAFCGYPYRVQVKARIQ